jgi:hypothetical protein
MSDPATYILIEVGCLECSVPSHVLGIYTDEAKAWAAYRRAGGDGDEWTTETHSLYGDEPSTTLAARISGSSDVQLHRLLSARKNQEQEPDA